ncbi:MAG TPA: hypothetical protein VI389_04085 [Geobacteraceae bacterium]
MRASTKNRMMGTFHKLRGSVRITLGNSFNKRGLAFSGRVERVGGIMQVKFGRMERRLGW